MQRDEDMKQKLLYRETLERQQQTKDYEKRFYGNMSRVEKEMNRYDLRTYKKNENELNCMIPGIRNIPSVGSQPTRGGHQLIKMQQELLNSSSVKDVSRPGIGTAKTNASAQVSSPIGGNNASILADDKSKKLRVTQNEQWRPE